MVGQSKHSVVTLMATRWLRSSKFKFENFPNPLRIKIRLRFFASQSQLVSNETYCANQIQAQKNKTAIYFNLTKYLDNSYLLFNLCISII